MKYNIGDTVLWVSRKQYGVIYSINHLAEYYQIKLGDGSICIIWEDELL